MNEVITAADSFRSLSSRPSMLPSSVPLLSAFLAFALAQFLKLFTTWFLKGINRFNGMAVSDYVMAGRFMLLHDSRNEDGIKSFFQEVHELYIKILLIPLYLPGSRITSSHFDTKARALARKYIYRPVEMEVP